MAPMVEKDLLTAFHPNGDALAITAGDGRIKTWDVRSGEMRSEFVDITTTSVGGADVAVNGHLSMDYTCLAWGPLLSVSSARKKKKGGKDRGGSAVVVLGNGAGDVLGWDTTLGELKWRTSDCHSGGVTSVAVGKSGQRVYSGGSDGMVCELDSNSGQVLSKFKAAKIPISCVAVSPDGCSVIAASAELKLFDLSSKKRLRKFSGHPAPVKTLLYTTDGKYVCSGAIGERHVAMWQIDGGKADNGVVCSFSLEQPAVSIDCSGFDKEGEILRVVAVSESGVAYVWSALTVAELSVARPTRISLGASSKGSKKVKQCVLAARLMADSGAVLVAHGTSAKPQFDRVSLDGQEGLSITLGATTNGVLLPAVSADDKIGQATQGVMVLGPDNAGDAVIPRVQVELASAKKSSKKKRRAEAEESEQERQPSLISAEESAQEPAEPNDEALAIVEDEQTMEEKLISLNLIPDNHNEETGDVEVAVLPPRVDSLQVLLSQALQADDNALLEQCLAVNDDKVILNTVRRLRPIEATKFLSLSVSKLEARPQRALSLIPWVRAVLLQQASFIMSNPAMQPVLTSLYQIIEARLSVFRPLLSLSGRLDLIMAQISANESKSNDVEETEATVFYEEEDSEPDALDAMVDEDSEDEDEDDGKDEDEDEDEDVDAMSEDGLQEDEVKVHGNGNGLSDGADSDHESGED